MSKEILLSIKLKKKREDSDTWPLCTLLWSYTQIKLRSQNWDGRAAVGQTDREHSKTEQRRHRLRGRKRDGAKPENPNYRAPGSLQSPVNTVFPQELSSGTHTHTRTFSYLPCCMKCHVRHPRTAATDLPWLLCLDLNGRKNSFNWKLRTGRARVECSEGTGSQSSKGLPVQIVYKQNPTWLLQDHLQASVSCQDLTHILSGSHNTTERHTALSWHHRPYPEGSEQRWESSTN